MEDEDMVPTVETGKEVEMEMDEEEMQMVEEGMRATLRRRTGRGPRRDPTKFVLSPITGELIPISEMAEHMRISLIDPKYKEQKERMMAKIRETTLAADDEISRNIVGLAKTRPDIFGTTEKEVSNAVKANIEKKDEQPKQVIWDGHTGSIGRTANQAMSQSLSEEEQTDVNVGNDGRLLLGPAPPPRPRVPSVHPLPPPIDMPGMPPRYTLLLHHQGRA